MQNYEEIMRAVDKRVASIDLKGEHTIENCKEIVAFLKEKMSELKAFIQSVPFNNEVEEISFFKYKKPILLGHLIYFHEILRIESQRPIGDELLDGYYEKWQEEQKLFFDRHVSFFQYYRSGVCYLDHHYFLRGGQKEGFDVDICLHDDDSEFSTGFDHLVARITAMEMLYAYLSERRRICLQRNSEDTSVGLLNMKGFYQWTGNAIELVEMVYGLNEMGCLNDGEIPIHELAAFMGTLFGVDVRDCYSAYTDMKRRKNESRTYFLDKMRERLNKRMQQDDERERKRK